jgi:hypothetical protein
MSEAAEPDELPALAVRIAALPPSCGPVRLVALDGHAGSGKSTCAGRLSALLGGAPVLHLDDVAAHGRFFGWTERLSEQVLVPLARGSTARFDVYDWDRRAFTGAAELPPAPVVLVEGVGAGRRALRPHLACLVWMDRDAAASWARGRHRDGAELAGFWREWTRAEEAHFAHDPSRPYADFLVRESPAGYRVRGQGPAAGRS